MQLFAWLGLGLCATLTLGITVFSSLTKHADLPISDAAIAQIKDIYAKHPGQKFATDEYHAAFQILLSEAHRWAVAHHATDAEGMDKVFECLADLQAEGELPSPVK